MAGRRALATFLTVGAVAALSLVVPDARAASSPPLDAAAGQVLVGLGSQLDAADVAELAGARTAKPLPYRPDVLLLEVEVGAERDIARRLQTDERVRWAAPNHIARAAAAPTDPLYQRQWHLAPRTTALGSSNWQPVHGTVTGRGVIVAVIDSGVTPNEDLDGMLVGIDFVDDDASPTDANGHGTHVAGTIGQSTDNGIGVAGVATDARVLPVRTLDATGAGLFSDVISGMSFAVQNGAKVLNLSIAGASDGGICDAVQRAKDAGVVVVAAAGNEAGPVKYPAACPAAIGVSATTRAGQLAPYSNRGPQVTLAAPGGDNGADTDLDGAPDGILQYSSSGTRSGYLYYAGTSMATPHVAGAVALLLETNPALRPDDVRSILTSTAFDLGAPGPDTSFGAGALDVAAAVAAAAQAPPPPPVVVQPEEPTETLPPPPAPSAPNGGGTQPTPETQPSTDADTSRVAGTDRFATSAATSRAAFSGGAERVYLASGRTFADALAAGAAAGSAPGPILLTDTCSLPSVIEEELRRLGPGEVIITGGEAAICSVVASQAAVAAGAPVRRVAGVDRYATAAALSRELAQPGGTAYLASGAVFADSLGGGAAAAAAQGSLLLTAPCALPEPTRAELERLQPKTLVVIGGEGAVCRDVLDAAKKASGSDEVRRVAGADRFTTSAMLTAGAKSGGAVVLASGEQFADGLSAGGLAAPQASPLLLVPACRVPDSVRDAVARLEPERVVVIGGQSAVCDAVLHELGAAAAGS